MKIAAFLIAVALGTFGLNSLQNNQLLAKRTPLQNPPAPQIHEPGSDYGSADQGLVCIPGQVQPRTKVTISTTMSLPVIELPLKEGDRVVSRGPHSDAPAPGSVLAKLDDGTLKAALRAAEAKRDAQAAEIDVAKVRLTALESQIARSRVCVGETQRNWGRYQQLINTDSASRTEIDEAHCKYDRAKTELDLATRSHEADRANLEVMQKRLKAAEQDVERARLDLASATISSPIDGVVTRVNVKVGEVVTGTITNTGTALMEVADMDHMVLVARLSEDQVANVKPGQAATVHLKACNTDLPGTVQKVALTSTDDKDGSHYFKAEIGLDTGGRLVPAGLTGEAKIACGVPALSAAINR